uniref:Uncharacterized protein n=1 Tax=Capra hircus TaxID=9925 RepID=A0A8C2REE7_CAPHI
RPDLGALLPFLGVSPYLSVSECDDICPPLRDTVDLFISGRHGAYIEQYNQNPDVLETADTLKSCVDERLTAEDKQDALSALVGSCRKTQSSLELLSWP